jgi:large subunit ribosomal protein L25
MEIVQLKAEKREELGKGPAKRLRRQGAIPGVAYGMARDPIHLSVSAAELGRVLHTSEGGNVLIDLKVPGAPRTKNTASIIKEIQRDPVSREALSVDFQWISLEEKITVEVPVEVTGTAPGVVDDGGVVQVQMHHVQVSCLPTEIPEQVVANIDGMHIGDALQAADLEVTSGVEILADPEEVLLSIAAPIREEELEVRVDEGLLEQLVDLAPGEELAVEEAEEVVAEAAEGAEEAEEEEAAEQPE